MSNSNIEEYAIDHTQQILDRFLNLAINRFTWTNLPTGLTSRKIEEYLIKHGRVAFFQDKNYGLTAFPCSGTGKYNAHSEPTQYRAFGLGYEHLIEDEECIIIRNNALATNDYTDLQTFAIRLNEVELTMDVNLNGQKTPFVILCDEKQRLTFKNILLQVRKFKYAIFGSNKLNIKDIDVLNTSTPYLLDKLQLQKRELMNELLTFLGINNNDVTKKERVVVDEINANNDFILVNLDHMFDERETACKLINEKFGTNIKVEKREVKFNGNLYTGVEGNNPTM